MCTNTELKTKLQLYCNVADEIKKLESIKKELSAFILDEMENRKTNKFENVLIITERLTESATKEGKAELKKMHGSEIDKYLSISYSQFINTRNAKRLYRKESNKMIINIMISIFIPLVCVYGLFTENVFRK